MQLWRSVRERLELAHGVGRRLQSFPVSSLTRAAMFSVSSASSSQTKAISMSLCSSRRLLPVSRTGSHVWPSGVLGDNGSDPIYELVSQIDDLNGERGQDVLSIQSVENRAPG